MKSIMTYGLLIYGKSANSNLANIDNVQRRSLRAIFLKKILFNAANDVPNKINMMDELFI